VTDRVRSKGHAARADLTTCAGRFYVGPGGALDDNNARMCLPIDPPRRRRDLGDQGRPDEAEHLRHHRARFTAGYRRDA
jgi:hypothetical protein